MNPADPMKLHLEDPRLTAYVLGELGADEASAVGQAIAADSALQAEVQAIEGIQQFLTQRLEIPAETLLPEQRENIRRQARSSSRPSGFRSLVAFREAIQPWIIPASAAAVLALATTIFFQMSGRTLSTKVVAKPKSVPASHQGQAAPPAIPPVIEPPQEMALAADPQTLDLPITTATTSLAAVSKSILSEGKLPPHESVHLGEILNNFPLRLNGVTSISRSTATTWHPDGRDSGMSNHAATLSTELIACPWKPSATLLLISIRANAKVGCDAKLAFHPNPATVLRHRLLGFSPSSGPATSGTSARMPAGAVTNIAMEIEPSSVGGDFGTLEWSTDGAAAPTISLVHNKDAEPSDDARFAALVCTFSLWLVGDSNGVIDAEVVAALAREIASAALPKERTEFLNLIDRSLHL